MDKIDIDKLKTYIKEQKEQLNMFGHITTLENDLKRTEKLINAYENIQKENEEKDKIIYELARSNVELKGYEIKKEYINNTISFYTKYVENLKNNPHWRKEE